MAPKSKRQKTQSSFSVDEADREKFVTALIGSSKYGHSYCESLGIRLGPNDSDSLYQWLCCSLLMSSGLSEKLTTRVCTTPLGFSACWHGLNCFVPRPACCSDVSISEPIGSNRCGTDPSFWHGAGEQGPPGCWPSQGPCQLQAGSP